MKRTICIVHFKPPLDITPQNSAMGPYSAVRAPVMRRRTGLRRATVVHKILHFHDFVACTTELLARRPFFKLISPVHELRLPSSPFHWSRSKENDAIEDSTHFSSYGLRTFVICIFWTASVPVFITYLKWAPSCEASVNNFCFLKLYFVHHLVAISASHLSLHG